MAGSPAAPVRGAFAFCDLAGFTTFTAEQGDAAAIALVETFGVHVSEALPTTARIVNRIGDGLLVHFADPSCAVVTLLALTQRCAEVATPESPLWVRTGVHAGSARSLGNDLIGHDVNVAARIGELACAEEVLVSEVARAEQAGAGVRFEALGPVFVKGLADAIRVYRASPVEAAVPAAP